MGQKERAAYCKRENDALRARSGFVDNDDPLVAFIYDLLRDHLAAGEVESLVKEALIFKGTAQYSNGYIANYARDIADRLRKKP